MSENWTSQTLNGKSGRCEEWINADKGTEVSSTITD
jgi:hypothetical protein